MNSILYWLTLWLNCWQSKQWWEHLLQLLAGLLGACVYIILTKEEIRLPRIREGKIELNFGGAFIVCSIIAVVVDIAFPIGVVAGIFALPMLLLLVKRLPKALVKALLAWLPKGGEK